MGPKDVVKAVEFLQPETAILMHDDTFDVIAQDAHRQPARLAPGEPRIA